MRQIVIDLGTQRSGTTLLASAINSSKECANPYIKELDVWSPIENELWNDKKFNEKNLNFWNGKNLKQLKIFKFHQRELKRILETRFVRFKLQNNTDNYFLYFKNLLELNNATISYDISPTYIGLKKKTLEKIYNGFGKIGINCKFILLMRDPVERNWSAVKKQFKKKQETSFHTLTFDQHYRYGIYSNISLEDSFLHYASNEYSHYFNNYKEVSENLEQFSKTDYLISGYDNIGSEAFKNQLKSFLKVNLNDFNFSQKINHSSNEELKETLFQKTAPLYKDIYDYCMINH